MALVFEQGWSEQRDLPPLSFVTNTASVFFVSEAVPEANGRDFAGGWIRSFTPSQRQKGHQSKSPAHTGGEVFCTGGVHAAN
jgi:hypothetical protein